jgi:hypothetical protein
LYQGPPLGLKPKKKSKPVECSPRLFLKNTSISTRVAAGGPSQKHTFGCLEDYLNVVTQCYYKEAAPQPEKTRAATSSKVSSKSSSSTSSASLSSKTTKSSSSSSSSSTTSCSASNVSTPNNPPNAHVFLQRETILGKLSNMWRQRSPIDTWAPLEIALFESALCIHGKGKFYLLHTIIFYRDILILLKLI